MVIVKPDTVVSWHRNCFRMFWTWKVRHGQPGRPVVSREVRDLIRQMCRENPTWGVAAPDANDDRFARQFESKLSCVHPERKFPPAAAKKANNPAKLGEVPPNPTGL